jgi:hypothetical protein
MRCCERLRCDRSICDDQKLASIAEGLWSRVENQGAAYQAEGEARRGERNQHGDREYREDD